VKFAVMLLLICLIGCAAAQGGYTQTQKLFMIGSDPTEISMTDFAFGQYVDAYWSSYIENQTDISVDQGRFGYPKDVKITMSAWMANFPFDVPSSSFGDAGVSGEPSRDAMARYDIGVGRGKLPVVSLHSEDGSVENNSQFLEQQIKTLFGP